MANVVAAIYAGIKLLAALPDLIKAIRSVISWLEIQFGPDWPQRLADLQAASVQWSKAVTARERADAASALAKAFNSRK